MTSPVAPSARVTALMVAAIAAVDAGVLLGFGTESMFALWWSSVGIAVALLAISPVRRWPLLVLAAASVTVVVRLLHGLDPGAALTIGSAHAAQALLGALVLTRGCRVVGRLQTQGDLLLVLLAAIGVGAVSVSELLSQPEGFAAAGAEDVLAVFAQHTVSTILLVAFVLVAPRLRRPVAHPAELVAQCLALLAVSVLVFAPGQDVPVVFAPIPFLVWGALRFDIGIMAAQLLAFACGVTLVTAHDSGSIAAAGVDDNLVGSLVLGYVLTAAFITLPLAVTVGQRHRLLAQVSADELLFRRNFTESPLGMLLMHDDGGDLVVNDLNTAACGILGAGPDELLGRRLVDVVDAPDPLERTLARLLDGTTDAWHGQAVVLGRPGSRLEMVVAALDRRRNHTRVYSAQLLDVTQEYDAHRRLQAAHKLTDATLDTTACIILVADSTGTIVRVNAATKDLTGYSDADLVGRRLWETELAALTRSETEAMFVWPNRSGYPMVKERLGHSAHGEPLRVVWSNNVVRDELGLPSYAVLTGIDVTAERSSTGLMTHLLSASIATTLVGIDTTGHITLFNAGASHMLGYSAEEMIGRPFVDLFDTRQLKARTGATGEHDAFLSIVGMIGDRNESLARDWTWRTQGGHELIVSMTLSVTDDQVEKRVGFLCVGRDVTEQREGQETLVAALEKERTAVERLRSLDRAKDEFVSTVSHELRTPVTSIIGFTEMLRDGTVVDPSPDQLPMLETIARNAQRLVTICNDLLLLSGFESEAAPGIQEPVDLRTCLASAHEWVSPMLRDQQVSVDMLPGDVPVVVTGDRSQLDRVLSNLVGNAVKFTPAGGSVWVSLATSDQTAVLAVRDTGIGIPADDHEAVFQRFYRTETAQLQAIPGTGLGLPIVAAIVESLGGRIELDSEPGRGTTFRVYLPLTDAPA